MEFLKKSTDPLLIEGSYRELALLEPTAQPGYHMKLVVGSPRRIPLSEQVLDEGIGVGGQWSVETRRKRIYHGLSPCDTGQVARTSRQPDYAEYTRLNLPGKSQRERLLAKGELTVPHNPACGIMWKISGE
jgi:hypothetical protein